MGCRDSAYTSHRRLPVLPRQRVFRKSSATTASGSQTEFGYEYVIEVECFPRLSFRNGPVHQRRAIPVLPAADTTESLNWWTEICGFKETFRDATPPNYAGINRGEAYLHIAGMSDKELARK